MKKILKIIYLLTLISLFISCSNGNTSTDANEKTSGTGENQTSSENPEAESPGTSTDDSGNTGNSTEDSADKDLKFEIGDIVTINGKPEGIVFYVDSDSGNTSGKILSLEKHQAMFCGLYTKACNENYGFQLVAKSSSTDGQNNWDLWCQLLPDFEGSSYYNAWYWCKYIKGLEWYIPAKDELIKINQQSNIINNTAAWLKGKGYTVDYFDEIKTWSSTPRSLNTDVEPYRLALWAGKGTASMLCNEDKYYVQPIRTFDKNTEGLGKMSTIPADSVPEFYKFDIPLVSYSKANNKVRTKITGKNFRLSTVKDSGFKASCTAKSSIVEDFSLWYPLDTTLYVDFTIPAEIGEYEITVSYGENSIKGKLKVQDFSSYSVGDVLLDDATVKKIDTDNLSFTDEEKQKAVGVLFGYNTYGVPLVLGLYNSAGGKNSGFYNWASTDIQAWRTTFTSIVCTPSESGKGTASTATFTDDIDGSDNWDIIGHVYSSDCANAKTNFPAFYYTNQYASTFSLSGINSSGWYMPSLAELCEIYKNKTLLNQILNALNGIPISNNHYWTSSQQGSQYNAAWTVGMKDGEIKGLGKGLSSNDYYSVCVCCIKAMYY